MLKNVFYLCGLLFVSCLFFANQAEASVYFITGDRGIGFSKQSYSCADGWHLSGSRCVKNVCSSATYPLSAKPDGNAGAIVSCKSGDETFYGYNTCTIGWNLQSGNCIINSCDGYPYSVSPDTTSGTVAFCKSGFNTFYKYSSCKTGWILSSGHCDAAVCDGYPFSSKPSTTIGTVSSTTCKSGSTTKYKYASCNTGWDLNNGACDVHSCDSTVYFNSVCPANATCAPCYTGGNIRYASASCNSGYEMSGGVCSILATTCKEWVQKVHPDKYPNTYFGDTTIYALPSAVGTYGPKYFDNALCQSMATPVINVNSGDTNIAAELNAVNVRNYVDNNYAYFGNGFKLQYGSQLAVENVVAPSTAPTWTIRDGSILKGYKLDVSRSQSSGPKIYIEKGGLYHMYQSQYGLPNFYVANGGALRVDWLTTNSAENVSKVINLEVGAMIASTGVGGFAALPFLQSCDSELRTVPCKKLLYPLSGPISMNELVSIATGSHGSFGSCF